MTKLEWDTPIKTLLRQCGWLSVNQLVVYHSSILVYKVMMTKSPMYLYSMFSSKYECDTRQARSGQIKLTRISNLDLSHESFRWRAAAVYNSLPASLRQDKSLKSFKTGLKKWIIDNIPVHRWIFLARVYHPFISRWMFGVYTWFVDRYSSVGAI